MGQNIIVTVYVRVVDPNKARRRTFFPRVTAVFLLKEAGDIQLRTGGACVRAFYMY